MMFACRLGAGFMAGRGIVAADPSRAFRAGVGGLRRVVPVVAGWVAARLRLRPVRRVQLPRLCPAPAAALPRPGPAPAAPNAP